MAKEPITYISPRVCLDFSGFFVAIQNNLYCNFSLLGKLVFTLCSPLLLSTPLYAQDSLADILRMQDQQAKKAAAKKDQIEKKLSNPKFTYSQQSKINFANNLGLTPGTRFYNRVIGEANQPTKNIEQFNLVKHIIGHSTVELPDSELLAKTYRTKYNKTVEKIGHTTLPKTLRHSKQVNPIEPSEFEICRISKRTFKSIDKTASAKVNKTEFDMLFLPKKGLKIDQKVTPDVFGKETKIRIVDEKSLGLHQAVKTFGFTCLPARVRVTTKKSFREQGIEALKNYDDNPLGTGKLPEAFKKLAREKFGA